MSEHPWRIPVTASVLSAAFSAGGMWAVLSAKVADAQSRTISAEARLTTEEQRNSSQDTAIAVAQQQFQEILRRLSAIETKIDDSQRK